MVKTSWLKSLLKTKKSINRIKITIMKLNIKSLLNIQTLVLIIVLFSPVLLNAQPSDPGSDPDVPIDGGLSVLLAAGVGYGIRELKKKRHK
jgi:hypothetical protein